MKGLTLRRLAVGVAAAAAITSMGTGAAHAERLAFTDQRGDVWSVDLEALDEDVRGPRDIPFEAARKVRNGDIVRTVVAHRRHRVVVKVDFEELRRAGEFRGDFLQFRTSEGRRLVMLYAGSGRWRGALAVVRPRSFSEVRCGATHEIDYRANTVQVSLPRACFGDPRWVRLRAESGWARLSQGRIYGDNAHNRSPYKYGFTQRVYAG